MPKTLLDIAMKFIIYHHHEQNIVSIVVCAGHNTYMYMHMDKGSLHVVKGIGIYTCMVAGRFYLYFEHVYRLEYCHVHIMRTLLAFSISKMIICLSTRYFFNDNLSTIFK